MDKIDDSKKNLPVTEKQKEIIEQILSDYPDTKEMHEYEDYLASPTIGTAYEFISRAVEDNAESFLSKKTYADYIATRPRAQRFGSHGLFTDDGTEIELTNVSEDLNFAVKIVNASASMTAFDGGICSEVIGMSLRKI